MLLYSEEGRKLPDDQFLLAGLRGRKRPLLLRASGDAGVVVTIGSAYMLTSTSSSTISNDRFGSSADGDECSLMEVLIRPTDPVLVKSEKPLSTVKSSCGVRSGSY